MTALHLDEVRAWLALLTARGVNRRRALGLLGHFGGALEAFMAPPALWEAVEVCACRPALMAAWHAVEDTAHATMAWLSESPFHQVLTLSDPAYPSDLLHSPDPPLMLFVCGQTPVWNKPMVAIVGSRHATVHGRRFASRLAGELVTCGAVVVSGLALGIDAAAHIGAIENDGATLAVVGNGVDVVYPTTHRDLKQQIQINGFIVSEHPLGTPALPAHFPSRNRIIAGLSLGVVVVEAALRSGSLITARLASEAGREVLAVPGALTSPLSAGCHALIKQGAALVEGIEDIKAALPALAPLGTRSACTGGGAGGDLVAASCPALDPQREALRQRLCSGPALMDELAADPMMSPPEWQAAVVAAEFDGMVARMPGGRVQWLG